MLATPSSNSLITSAVSPFKEIVAYEALWQNEKASFKTLSQLFAQNPGSCKNLILEHKPDASVFGIFVARRVIEKLDAVDEFDDEWDI